MKRCRKCGRTLEIEENFYRHSQMADGYLNFCKECVRTRVTVHRDENVDRIRKYDRNRGRSKERIARAKAYQRAHPGMRFRATLLYRNRYPEKHLAHVATRKAILDGILVRQPCEVCGDPKSEAHHDDYQKALSVRWLCNAHHRSHHNEIREAARNTA